jgi:hypothetical protein
VAGTRDRGSAPAPARRRLAGHRHHGPPPRSDGAEQMEWSRAVRGENAVTRLDRHFGELLQELRITQTGVQILFAFLLGLAFTPAFPHLSRGQHWLYLATLTFAGGSAAVLIAPVSHHRMVYERRLRADLVRMTDRFVRVGLVLLLIAMVGAVDLAASFVLGLWAAALAAGIAAVFAVCWYAVPLWSRRRTPVAEDGSEVRDVPVPATAVERPRPQSRPGGQVSRAAAGRRGSRGAAPRTAAFVASRNT